MLVLNVNHIFHHKKLWIYVARTGAPEKALPSAGSRRIAGAGSAVPQTGIVTSLLLRSADKIRYPPGTSKPLHCSRLKEAGSSVLLCESRDIHIQIC